MTRGAVRAETCVGNISGSVRIRLTIRRQQDTSTTSVEQYAGTLARWFGLSDGQIKTVFPNFGNFGSSPYLGLMG